MTEPIVPPIQSNPDLKQYFCPHCDRFLFKGNVKNVKMVCPHCQKLITALDTDLMKSVPPKETAEKIQPFAGEDDA